MQMRPFVPHNNVAALLHLDKAHKDGHQQLNCRYISSRWRVAYDAKVLTTTRLAWWTVMGLQAFQLIEAGEMHPLLLTFSAEIEAAYMQHMAVVVQAHSGKHTSTSLTHAAMLAPAVELQFFLMRSVLLQTNS